MPTTASATRISIICIVNPNTCSCCVLANRYAYSHKIEYAMEELLDLDRYV